MPSPAPRACARRPYWRSGPAPFTCSGALPARFPDPKGESWGGAPRPQPWERLDRARAERGCGPSRGCTLARPSLLPGSVGPGNSSEDDEGSSLLQTARLKLRVSHGKARGPQISASPHSQLLTWSKECTGEFAHRTRRDRLEICSQEGKVGSGGCLAFQLGFLQLTQY